MCEYCGCQALAAVALLTAEHDEAANLSGLIRRALDAGEPAAAAALGRDLARLLGPHTAVEEGALFPALQGDFPDHVARLAGEHRLIEEALAEAVAAADRLPGDGTWTDRLRAALHVLDEHILAEQNGVFPAALANLGEPEWARVEEVRAEVGSALEAGARG